MAWIVTYTEDRYDDKETFRSEYSAKQFVKELRESSHATNIQIYEKYAHKRSWVDIQTPSSRRSPSAYPKRTASGSVKMAFYKITVFTRTGSRDFTFRNPQALKTFIAKIKTKRNYIKHTVRSANTRIRY